MAKDNYHSKIKRSAQITIELVIAIVVLATLFIFTIGLWSRMAGTGNEGIIPNVRWFVNQRLGLAGNPDSVYSPSEEAEIDLSNLDASLQELDNKIADLTEEKEQCLSDAQAAKQESLSIRTNNLQEGYRHSPSPLLTLGYYYYDTVDWQLSRAKMLTAVFLTDAANELQEAIDELNQKRDKIQEARDLLAQAAQTSDPQQAEALVNQANEILSSLDEYSTSEERVHHDAAELQAEADALDSEARQLVTQAGYHWNPMFGQNQWYWRIEYFTYRGTNCNWQVHYDLAFVSCDNCHMVPIPGTVHSECQCDCVYNDQDARRAEAISDEGLYEEAEAKSNIVDPLHDGSDIEGLAQSKRRQAEELLASIGE